MFNAREIQEQVIYTAVKNESNEDIARHIVCNPGEDNPTWVNNTMRRLDAKFDASTVKKIRMNCQCGYGMDEKLAFVKELLSVSSSLEEFGNNEKAKAAGLSFSNGELFLGFPFCPCPMLADVERLETKTWCQCTTGYSKVLFEKAFGCKVDVELLKSVKAGDEVCLMKIIPQGKVGNLKTMVSGS
ncbi:MAG: DUF6144 family protein [Bacteroidales bacterium]|jgi:predicted hydrocarbon binding protein|nr:DUF6144 family protein [Bacteroidales bacterium]